jgi:hypothetical protein
MRITVRERSRAVNVRATESVIRIAMHEHRQHSNM